MRREVFIGKAVNQREGRVWKYLGSKYLTIKTFDGIVTCSDDGHAYDWWVCFIEVTILIGGYGTMRQI